MAIAIDGTPVNNGAGGVTSLTFTLTTTQPNDIIVVDLILGVTSAHSVLTCASPTLGSFLLRAQNDNSSANTSTWRFWQVSASPLTAEVITVTATVAEYIEGTAFGISGANTISPWQVPNVAANSVPQNIVPTGPALLIADVDINGPITVDPGWTNIAAAPRNFSITEYLVVASGGSVTVNAGGASTNSVLIDAVNPAAPSGIAVWPYGM